MWTTILSLLASLFGWLTRKDERDGEREAGETLGKAEAQRDDAVSEIQTIDAVQSARAGIGDGTGGVPVDTDPNNRNRIGAPDK